MLRKLSERIHSEERGFTLIELLVVILISESWPPSRCRRSSDSARRARTRARSRTPATWSRPSSRATPTRRRTWAAGQPGRDRVRHHHRYRQRPGQPRTLAAGNYQVVGEVRVGQQFTITKAASGRSPVRAATTGSGACPSGVAGNPLLNKTFRDGRAFGPARCRFWPGAVRAGATGSFSARWRSRSRSWPSFGAVRRKLPQRGDLPRAAGRVDRRPRLALPACDAPVAAYDNVPRGLVAAPARPLPPLRRADLAALPDRRAAHRRRLRRWWWRVRGLRRPTCCSSFRSRPA